MKKIIAVIFALLIISAVQDIQAGGVIVYHNGPAFEKLEELPADVIIDGQHVNVGIAYKQFGLFWLPLWNYGTVEYVLVSDNKETAWALSGQDIEAIKEDYNIQFAENPSPSLWSQIGLKPLVVIFIIWVLWTYLRKEKTEPAIEEKTDETTA